MDASERAFGRARALTLVRRMRRDSPREIVDTLIAGVRSHISPAPQADDLTALVVKFPSTSPRDDAEGMVGGSGQPARLPILSR
jgi:hypothetical protein